MRPKSKNHPSIVTLTAEQTKPLGYQILIDDLDREAHNDTLLEGDLTLLQGPIGAGRTAKLVDIAAYNTQWGAMQADRQVLIATVENDPMLIVKRLRDAGLTSESTMGNHIRIAQVRTAGELALFVAHVVSAGGRPGLLLIDDLGLLDADDLDERSRAKAAHTARLLARGSIASAVEKATGAPFGAFAGLEPVAATTAPMAVLATVRAARDGSRWSNVSAVGMADYMFTLDGVTLKAREPLSRRAS